MPQATAETLAEALPHVLAAPKDDAPIQTLCFRKGFGKRDFRDSLTLTVAEGIPGERWLKHPWMKLADGSPDPRIQLSILGARVVEAVVTEPDMLHPGDTIIADMDFSEENLPVGTRLQIGTAVVEVSDLWNDACVKWKKRYGKPAFDWVRAPGHPELRLRGVLCRIIEDGEVTLTDRIRKI